MAKKILIVDDSVVTCSMLAERINSAGFQTISAHTGQQGLDLMHKEHPDLVMLDIRMPGMDGFEVCRLAKSDLDIKNIPIVFVTTSGQKKDRDRAQALGASGYITKPYEGKLLMAEIKRIIENG